MLWLGIAVAYGIGFCQRSIVLLLNRMGLHYWGYHAVLRQGMLPQHTSPAPCDITARCRAFDREHCALPVCHSQLSSQYKFGLLTFFSSRASTLNYVFLLESFPDCLQGLAPTYPRCSAAPGRGVYPLYP